MMMKMTVKEINHTDMRLKTLFKCLLFIFILLGIGSSSSQAQGDDLPVREYTNPEEIVTFDRTTSFARAIDVINEFSQEYRNKPVLDRTNTEGEIGISVAPKHWMDALKLILRVKELQLVERKEFFEIVDPEQMEEGRKQKVAATQGGGEDGEGPLATIQTKEVRINAIFFEGNRRALREIGVDWSTISENTPEAVTGAGQEGVQIPSTEFGDGPFVQVNSEGASNVSQRVFESVINFGEIGNSGISVQSLFSAFEAENLGEILSSPTVKVMDGQEGRIQVGQDFSVKQRDFAGNVVEEFFSVGTILEVLPTIIEQNDTTFVHLDISAERSSAQPDPVSTVINKQQAETQALLLDGQATVIAGLYRTERSQVRRGIPLLKDLPPWFFGLRYLFGYTSNDFLMRELVILLQVSIEPTIPERLNEGIITNKFESLRKQREQNRRDIEESDRIFSGQKLSENLDLETNDDYEPEREKIEDDIDEEPSQGEKEEVEIEKTDPQQLSEEEAKIEIDTTIADPEMKAEEIEINLGGEQQNDVEEEQQEKLPSEEASEASFYIIGGSFEITENAQFLKDELQRKGYNPVILEAKDSNLKMVAYGKYNDAEKARRDLEVIQENENSEAWLYRAR